MKGELWPIVKKGNEIYWSFISFLTYHLEVDLRRFIILLKIRVYNF